MGIQQLIAEFGSLSDEALYVLMAAFAAFTVTWNVAVAKAQEVRRLRE